MMLTQVAKTCCLKIPFPGDPTCRYVVCRFNMWLYVFSLFAGVSLSSSALWPDFDLRLPVTLKMEIYFIMESFLCAS